MAKIAAADIDVSTDEPVLHYTGETAPADVPHRDLNAADLLRIHHVRALQASSGEPVAASRPMDAAAVANDLLDWPGFSARAVSDKPAKASARKAPKKQATAPAAAPAVAEPADPVSTEPIEAPASPAQEG
ncbi:MAG: hypothetical protein JO246_14080 [Frankiaceae bacterium]|nr:hypothetical protein [Frankiaceae bacterium]MBV9872493.1 hypothetical protein [Frankiaceae bacterium]